MPTAGRPRELIRRTLVHDDGSIAVTLAIAAVVLASRVPLLGHGYGGDPDGWRAISAARHLLDTGSYVPSRVPGYPLPEYVDAALIQVGLGSSWTIGLLSALLSGIAAALFFRLLMPLGRKRAVAGAMALAFTPAVYVASLGAMDYVWGLTFFLAATLCLRADRMWAAGVLLGLAAASRPSYALSIIPLALLAHSLHRERHGDHRTRWRIAGLALGSGLVALAFFMPAFLAVGVQLPTAYTGWRHILANGSVGLFGVIGTVAVATVALLAARNRRRGVRVPEPAGHGFDRWAWIVLVLYGLLFLRIPDESAYLIPALLGLYWLLCRYAPESGTVLIATALAVSCFFLTVEQDGDGGTLAMAGPVIDEIRQQDERSCVGEVVEQRLDDSPDQSTYVVAGSYRPQLQVQTDPQLADRILYTVVQDADGRLRDTEGDEIRGGSKLLLLDRAAAQQSQTWTGLEGVAAILDSYTDCPRS